MIPLTAENDVAGTLGTFRRGIDAQQAWTGLLVPQAFGGNNQSGAIDVATARSSSSPHGRLDFESETFIVGAMPAAGGTDKKHGHGWGQQEYESGYIVPVAHALRREGHDASEDGTGRGVPVIAFDTSQVTSKANRSNPKAGDPCHTLARGAQPPAIAFSAKDHGADASEELSPTLRSGGHDASHPNGGVMPAVAFNWQSGGDARGLKLQAQAQAQALSRTQTPAIYAGASAVRRLMPVECERLQGFPDAWTDIIYRGKKAADDPRYKAIGNSMAVPVIGYILTRINLVDKILM